MTTGEKTTELATIAFADDSHITQLLLKTLINHDERFTLLIEADHGQMLLESLASASILPKVCILDLYMQPTNGIETARQINQIYPEIITFGYTTSTEEKDIYDMRDAGAANVFDKNRVSVGELLDHIDEFLTNNR